MGRAVVEAEGADVPGAVLVTGVGAAVPLVGWLVVVVGAAVVEIEDGGNVVDPTVDAAVGPRVDEVGTAVDKVGAEVTAALGDDVDVVGSPVVVVGIEVLLVEVVVATLVGVAVAPVEAVDVGTAVPAEGADADPVGSPVAAAVVVVGRAVSEERDGEKVATVVVVLEDAGVDAIVPVVDELVDDADVGTLVELAGTEVTDAVEDDTEPEVDGIDVLKVGALLDNVGEAFKLEGDDVPVVPLDADVGVDNKLDGEAVVADDDAIVVTDVGSPVATVGRPAPELGLPVPAVGPDVDNVGRVIDRVGATVFDGAALESVGVGVVANDGNVGVADTGDGVGSEPLSGAEVNGVVVRPGEMEGANWAGKEEATTEGLKLAPVTEGFAENVGGTDESNVAAGALLAKVGNRGAAGGDAEDTLSGVVAVVVMIGLEVVILKTPRTSLGFMSSYVTNCWAP